MTINEYSETFEGRKVVNFSHGDTPQPADANVVYRLVQDWEAEETQAELLQDFFSKVPPGQVEALVIGAWGESQENSPQEYLDGLIARRAELPNLKALFVGDMTYEDCEISWIVQTGYNALLDAFPQLEVLRVRGTTEGLELKPFKHAALRKLVIEGGGLGNDIVAAIAASELPALEHLELWLGSEDYGFDGDLDTYVKAVTALRPERLKVLALRNAEIADDLARWLAQQPWIAQLELLDLSKGTLGDTGAQALLESPHLAGLGKLDLSHHYISAPMQEKLRAMPLTVVLDDAQEEDEYGRFVEVGE
ncbi:hypothetical protein CO615_05185 [Lysobacteraceae bacterium NML75-0749]|nr:hypothetical protein CO615_05185 [Xanthomonadaceae bacterium NML75-0749]